MNRKLALITLSIILSISAYSSEIVIAVNKRSPRKTISLKELKSIFTGEKAEWSDGENIKVIDYKRDTSIKKVFCQKVLKISQVQLYKKWIRASLLGNSSEIILVNGPQDVIGHLEQDPKSVGYLEKSQLNNINLRKLKVTK